MSEAGSSYRIRPARPEELAAIRELTLAAYEEFAASMTPTAWAGLRGALLAALPAEAERLVAEEAGGRLIGSVMLFAPATADYGDPSAASPDPELRLLAVAPACRGRSVGEALVRACIARARQLGARALGLHTSESLKAGIRLYERLGFERVPERDFQPPGAELVMGYRLWLDDGPAGG